MLWVRLLGCIVLIAGIVFNQPIVGQSTSPDLAVIVYQQNINKLLGMMGPISGKSNYNVAISSGELNWEVRNPRIEIVQGSAKFVADTTVKAGFLSSNPQAFGKVDIQYDHKQHKIKLKLTQVGFDSFIELFGSKTKIASVDLSQYFKQTYEFDAPVVPTTTVKVPVSESTIKTLRVTPGAPSLTLETGKIVLTIPVDYTEIE